MRLYFSSWIREADRRTIEEIGIPSTVLMENAARGAATSIIQNFPQFDFPNCLILVGRGNNGGDGLAVGRILYDQGYSVRLLLTHPPEELSPDARLNLEIASRIGVPAHVVITTAEIESQIAACCRGGAFIVDALFGTGLNGPLRAGFGTEVIALANQSGFPIVALDVPSGLGESHLPDECTHIRAALTVTFGGLKWALFHPDGHSHCGSIRLVDIGIPRFVLASQPFPFSLVEPGQFSALLESRRADAHKGTFGHVLAIAGSRDKPGAGLLSAFAALASGAGLVSAAVPEENRSLYVKTHPELMTVPIDQPDLLEKSLLGSQAVLLGPGLGIGEKTAGLVDWAVRTARCPLVLDADALNVLDMAAWEPTPPGLIRVFTPHPGEFARLTGLSVQEIGRDRLGTSREFAQKHRIYLVLKGHHTVVATPAGAVYINSTGNPGMATAGSGDVLTGMIAGLLATVRDEVQCENAVIAAVFLHGRAGDLAKVAKGERGLTASDILATIPGAFTTLHEYQNPIQ